MDPRSQLGLMLILFGALMILGGFAIIYADKIPYLGHLPGDISIHGKNWSFHFPIVTGLILSIVLSLILTLFFRR
jgi:thiosulfate reductase cytochrome b subunit